MTLFAKLAGRFGRRVTLVEKRPEPEVLCKPQRMTGILALLTPEQQEKALSYSGPESHGSEGFRLAH